MKWLRHQIVQTIHTRYRRRSYQSVCWYIGTRCRCTTRKAAPLKWESFDACPGPLRADLEVGWVEERSDEAHRSGQRPTRWASSLRSSTHPTSPEYQS